MYRNKLILYGCGDTINDYEGIRGYEAYRPDLRLLYFASVDSDSGELASLRMVPMQARNLRLRRASSADVEWLGSTLQDVSRHYGTGIERESDGMLTLRWDFGARSWGPSPLLRPGSGGRFWSVGHGGGRMLFINRADAGRRLGKRLQHLQGEDVVVLGLPRGGVPVAAEVARALDAPLDVIVVRKLGVPFQPELGMGAIGEGGVRVLNDALMRSAGVTQDELAAVEHRERAELERRTRRFRGGRARIPLTGHTAVVIDDGIATGSTARAACQVARAQGAARVVLAVPVAPSDWTRGFEGIADELICLTTPRVFFGIGQFYADFSQTSDEEVIACLGPAVARSAPAAGLVSVGLADDPPDRDEEVEVRAGRARVRGHLTVPESATGIVVFAHGSGSSRYSPRNRYVAAVLNRAGLGTLLIDLLTRDEELDRATVFDIELLTQRLADATAWLRTQPEASTASIGYFGASTGAAAALRAAAEPPTRIAAVVCRGGRPDLAAPRLAEVTAPTLLIVGGHDDVVLQLNRQAHARLRDSKLVVVPGATHLFEEPGALEQVAELAREWFTTYFTAQPTIAPR